MTVRTRRGRNVTGSRGPVFVCESAKHQGLWPNQKTSLPIRSGALCVANCVAASNRVLSVGPGASLPRIAPRVLLLSVVAHTGSLNFRNLRIARSLKRSGTEKDTGFRLPPLPTGEDCRSGTQPSWASISRFSNANVINCLQLNVSVSLSTQENLAYQFHLCLLYQ